MSQMMFYENVVPLNRDRHRHLRLKRAEGDCAFAASASAVPLAGVEFIQACRDYPILISGPEDDPVPVALLGLRQGANLFVGADGRWARNCYVPAFVRRYPFVLARGEEDRFTVCIDDSYPGLGESDGDALFTSEGEETPLLRESISLLRGYHGEMERTLPFLRRLGELGLITGRELQVTGGDTGSLLLKGFRVIDEARLQSLDDAVVLELHRAGYWPWIHAQLVSVGNLARLRARQA